MKPTSICKNRKMADLSLRNSYQWGWKIQQTLHSSQIKTTAFRPGFTEFLGKSSIFASSVIYPSVLKSLSTSSFHCLTLVLPENMQKIPLFSEITVAEIHAHSPPQTPQEWSAPGLRVIGVERLLEPVAGARGHLVHTCSQKSKRHFQREEHLFHWAIPTSGVPRQCLSFLTYHIPDQKCIFHCLRTASYQWPTDSKVCLPGQDFHFPSFNSLQWFSLRRPS